MTRAELIQYITDNVYPNARNEVTAPMVRDSLLEVVDFLGDAATYNIGMVATGNQGLVTGGNVKTAIALALLPYYTSDETDIAIDAAIQAIGLGQAAYKDLGQVASGDTGLVTGGQVYSAIDTAITAAIKFRGVSDTALTDGSTTNPIMINGQSFTAQMGDMVIYAGNEFLWVGNKWQQMGDESSYALKTITVTGTGYLTGGGDLTQNRTLDISTTAKSYIDHGETAYGYFTNGVLDTAHLPSMYIGTTSVQFTAVAQNLTGISSVRATNDISTLFEWDSTNSAWHFHGSIYADGFFSGGGISPGGGGGGGGGIDPVAMWQLLTNNPSLTQYDNYTKIAADHINFPVTSVVGLTGGITSAQIAQALNLGSLAYKSSLLVSDIPDLSGTYVTLSTVQTITNWKVYSGEVGNAYKILRKAAGGGGWAYTPLRFTGADDADFFHIGAFGGDADLSYAYVGCNAYSGLNLRISPSTLSWGDNTIYHAGNSNKSDVAWNCSTLTASSTVSAPGFRSGAICIETNADGTTAGRGQEINNYTGPIYLQYNTGNNIILCIGGGNVGVGKNPEYKFDVAGVVHASTGLWTDGYFSGGGIASSSDKRLKREIRDFAYSPSLLMALLPREWEWNDKAVMKGHAAGFVAQEIEPLMPYMVNNEHDYKALFYDQFHALEVSALQDHERRIVELEKENRELRKRLNMN